MVNNAGKKKKLSPAPRSHLRSSGISYATSTYIKIPVTLGLIRQTDKARKVPQCSFDVLLLFSNTFPVRYSLLRPSERFQHVENMGPPPLVLNRLTDATDKKDVL